MLEILSVTFPFFALVLLGWAVARRGVMPLEAIGGLNVFVLFYALPCMLYRFASGTPIVRLLDAGVTVTYLLCAVAMVGLTVATTRARRVGWNDASFGALATAFPNSGFMGVPLLVALLGPAAAGPAIVCLAVDMVFTSSLCIALSRLGGAGGARQAAWSAAKGMVGNPLPWAIVLGTLSSASGVAPPPAALRVIGMLADAASPVALFALGAVLARSQRVRPAASAGGARQPLAGVPQAVLCKLLLHPLLAFGLGKLAMAAGLPLDAFSLTVLVLAAALPSASNVPILAERFGADAGRVARIVLFSTAAAFASFTAAVAVLR